MCGRIGSIFRVAERAGIPVAALKDLAEHAIPLAAEHRRRLLELGAEVLRPIRAHGATDAGAWA